MSKELVARLRGPVIAALFDGKPSDWQEAEAEIKAAADLIEHQSWQPIETAPRDGTRILIWFVHSNAKFSDDPVGHGWEAAHEAHWIDHNGGGWTWHGLAGSPTHWMPLPESPTQ